MNRTLIGLAIAAGIVALPSQAETYKFSEAKSQRSIAKFQRIIDGKEVEPNAYPFMTALTSANREEISPFCGASFVGGRYVMTASHCVEGSNAEDMDVWIGGFDTEDPTSGKRVKVAQIYEHESYNDLPTNNDIAILELVEEVEGVTPIKLLTPEIEATLADGAEMTVMGWGNTVTEGFPEYPTKLREVNVPLYNRAQCQADYTPEGETESGITEQMLCAGFVEGGKDSCQGDSGGPLIYKHEDEWYQAGVVSFGNGCAQANAPGVYARVSQFNEWVTQKKAGVSYRQINRQGYVEKAFDENKVFTVKNVSQTPFSVTAASVSGTANIERAAVTNNACLDRELSYNDTCDITVNVKTNMVGQGGFGLNIKTTNTVNPSADLFFNANSLESEVADVAGLTGSDQRLVKWWGGGTLNWQASTAKSSQGDSSIASGDISHFDNSVLLATIESDRVTEFDYSYLISSEPGWDFMRVYLNNALVLRVTGTEQVEFKNEKLELSEGVDRIAFVYAKDQSDFGEIGDDKAYVDNVKTTFSNQAPTVRLARSTISVEEGKNFTLDASSTTDADGDALSYSWQVTSGQGVTITNPTSAAITLVAPAHKDVKSVGLRVTVTDAFGASSSQNATVTVTPKPSSGGSMPLTALAAMMVLAFRRFLK